MEQICNSSLRYIKAKEGNKVEIFMTHIIMIQEIIKLDIDQIAEIEEFSLMGKAKLDQGMNRIIGEEI